MKKLTAAFLTAAFFASQTASAAVSGPVTVPVTATVGDVFSLTVTPAAIALGTIVPGTQTAPVVVHLSVATNRGQDWAVQLNGDNLNNGGTYDFPLSYNWVYNYTGDDASITLTPAFPASANITGVLANIIHRADTGVLLGSDYAIGVFANVPAAAPAGAYSANLYFTLTDEI